MAQDLDDDLFDDPGFSNGEELYEPNSPRRNEIKEREWVEYRIRNLSAEANLNLSQYVIGKSKTKPKRGYFAAALFFLTISALIFVYLIYSIYG